jgi:hypothetical protein
LADVLASVDAALARTRTRAGAERRT